MPRVGRRPSVGELYFAERLRDETTQPEQDAGDDDTVTR